MSDKRGLTGWDMVFVFLITTIVTVLVILIVSGLFNGLKIKMESGPVPLDPTNDNRFRFKSHTEFKRHDYYVVLVDGQYYIVVTSQMTGAPVAITPHFPRDKQKPEIE